MKKAIMENLRGSIREIQFVKFMEGRGFIYIPKGEGQTMTDCAQFKLYQYDKEKVEELNAALARVKEILSSMKRIEKEKDEK